MLEFLYTVAGVTGIILVVKSELDWATGKNRKPYI